AESASASPVCVWNRTSGAAAPGRSKAPCALTADVALAAVVDGSLSRSRHPKAESAAQARPSAASRVDFEGRRRMSSLWRDPRSKGRRASPKNLPRTLRGARQADLFRLTGAIE